MSIVTVQVSSGAERVASERRFDKGITILALKMKLEMITGSEAGHQDLRLYDCNNVEIGKMDNNDAMLGAYPIESGMRIHVIDTNPFKTRNEFGDVSKVEKFEMADEDYAKRSDSVMAFKARNKLGRFNPEFATKAEQKEHEFEDEAREIQKGSRCEVTVQGQPPKRGVVMFVGSKTCIRFPCFVCSSLANSAEGQTQFQPGWWIGVKYDEPVGKHDGSVGGVKYFQCENKYGAFVRPNCVKVGDYPEELLLSDDEM
eukprot:m.48735 g.48735  ORF g.48735 m.48735 type:complete len:257 (+) comp47783_c0_seq4:100-870(+)